MGVPLFSWLFFMMTLHSLILPCFCMSMAFGQCLGDQQSLLLQLKNDLVFHKGISTKLVHWNESTDCCLWEGVTCSEGRVIGLDLSSEGIYNGLNDSSSLFGLQYLQNLSLANNNFSFRNSTYEIPSKLDRLTNLIYLNLSNAGFGGQIPIAISRLTRLVVLDLSRRPSCRSAYERSCDQRPSTKLENPNLKMLVQNLSELIEIHLDGVNISAPGNEWCEALSSSLPNLRVLSLSNCYLSGPLDPSLINLQALVSINLEYNNLNTSVPEFLGDFKNLRYLFLGGCRLYGTFPKKIFQKSIPASICNISELQVLDMSNNSLSGTIPDCLFQNNHMAVLNLESNNLSGKIPDTFPGDCSLETLTLNRNKLEGGLPKSLDNCRSLQVLDLGNNHIQDIFPCYLKNISSLRVLVLRSNKFYGSIGCPSHNATWPMLQIIDLASNNFSGNLPSNSLAGWKAMTIDEVGAKLNPDSLESLDYVGRYYQDTVTIPIEGRYQLKLVRIPTMFASIDFSCNNFDGHIPEELGGLKSLCFLNLSHNAFTGQIPSTLGKLSNLESLDLSINELTGEIPLQLANGLIFLSVLNLSFNQLVGKIPLINQFATFLEISYEGNKGLCGPPLKEKCIGDGAPTSSPPIFEETHSHSGILVDWNVLSVELGFVFGFGIVIWPLMFWKRWRFWYSKKIDEILFKIFPKLYLGREPSQGSAQKSSWEETSRIVRRSNQSGVSNLSLFLDIMENKNLYVI